MILYLSSATESAHFSLLFSKGYIKSSLQAQRFNNLVAEGLSRSTIVYAVGHPQYTKGIGKIPDTQIEKEQIFYHTLGNNPGFFHRITNFYSLFVHCKNVIKKEKPFAIVCDSYDILYSLMTFILSRIFLIKTVAVVTDLPQFFGNGQMSLMGRFTLWLMKRYDSYVFLTKAMNELINPQNKPYIVMEGVCNDSSCESVPLKTNGKRVCAYMGSLSKNIGVENLLEAFKDSALNDIILVVYGGGDIEDVVEKASLEYSNIEYGGLVSNEKASQLQHEVSLLINPRPVDIGYAAYSFPSKIMEYMSSGTPVMTTRLAGIPDEYFDYVYTIESDKPNGIREAIKNFFQQTEAERSLKGESARKFVIEKKNNTVQGKRILDLINQIKQ